MHAALRPESLFAAVVAGAGLVSPASAAIITFTNTALEQNGTGFGNVLNVLALHNNGSEWGAVTSLGGLSTLSGNATNQSQLVSVSDLSRAGVTAENLALVFNINERGSAPDVTLQAFSMIFYDAAGNELFTAAYTGPSLTLEPVGMGTGQAGWLFDVDLTAAEASQFFSDPANSVGMMVPESSPILNSWGGPENFYIVPTPGAAVLIALAVVAGKRRRRSDSTS